MLNVYSQFGVRTDKIRAAECLSPARKTQLAELSKNTMLTICKTSGNKDIEPFIEQIIKSVLYPEEISNCVHALASTVFVQKVESAALAIVEPLIVGEIRYMYRIIHVGVLDTTQTIMC